MDVGSMLGETGTLTVHAPSVATAGGLELALVDGEGTTRLAILAPDELHPGDGSDRLTSFEGETLRHARGRLLLGPRSPHNAAALRELLPWLRPQTFGLRTSAGFGDRLGSATPGHIRALRAVGGDIAPILAQQSIREMERTGRDAQEILDDAMWGVFAEGWRNGYGADADHLKTTADIDRCLAAGYTFYTFDPSEHVSDVGEHASPAGIAQAYDSLPWTELEETPDGLARRYADDVVVEGHTVAFGDGVIQRAAVKYGRAIAHVAILARHLRSVAGDHPAEVEVSVDETEEPTSHAEHVFIAREMTRLGVEWASLAPRYVGRFEKGVDYIGEPAGFADDIAVHAAIARTYGPYKLSLHSGSDKFSIYPIAVEATGGRVHLKTAGTSYLEALRAMATLDPDGFREIYRFSRGRFETDKASYHISATLDGALEADAVDNLPALLDEFNARQILHVTFGSVLTAQDADGNSRFRDGLNAQIARNPEAYAAVLERHFVRHLEPFVTPDQGRIHGQGTTR